MSQQPKLPRSLNSQWGNKATANGNNKSPYTPEFLTKGGLVTAGLNLNRHGLCVYQSFLAEDLKPAFFIEGQKEER